MLCLAFFHSISFLTTIHSVQCYAFPIDPIPPILSAHLFIPSISLLLLNLMRKTLSRYSAEFAGISKITGNTLMYILQAEQNYLE